LSSPTGAVFMGNTSGSSAAGTAAINARVAPSQTNGAAAANLAGTQEVPIWSKEVLDVAEQQQLRPLLEPMLKATRQIFPTARWIKVYAELDFQEPGEKNIIFDV